MNRSAPEARNEPYPLPSEPWAVIQPLIDDQDEPRLDVKEQRSP